MKILNTRWPEAEAETEKEMKARMANGYVRMVSSSASRRTCLVVGSYAKRYISGTVI